MQTPQNGQTGYSSNYPALVRARVLYNYDVSGTMLSSATTWDTWNGSSYTTGPILGAQCAYDPYKVLKTQTQWYAKNPEQQHLALWSGPRLRLRRGPRHTDGRKLQRWPANREPTWSYDAAGKRTDLNSTFDNLNGRRQSRV